jgi:hypothetical protein
MASKRMLAMDHPTAKLVSVLIRQLLVVEARLPFLLAVKAEGERMVATGGRLRNDVALRMFQDSHDMLVIDLDSLREHAIEIFRRLHQHPNILRHFRAKDMRDGTDTEFNEFLAKGCNEHFDALFPEGEPAEDAQRIDNMIKRFEADTEPTERDRNDARAHRFGKRAKNAQAAFQTLEKVAEQVEVFKTYFRNVFMVLTGGNYMMDSVMFQWDWETTARDMADLIVLGSIEDAVERYGLVGEHEDNRLRYWHSRKQFFEAGGKITDPPPHGP